MQNRSSCQRYPLQYAPFHFLEDIRLPPFFFMEYQLHASEIAALHCHDGLELGLCTEGSGTFIINGESLPFQAPCAVILYPHQYHRARSSCGSSRWYFATICPELLLPEPWGQEGAVWPGPESVEPESCILMEDTAIYRLVEQIIAELQMQKPQFQPCVGGLLQALLVLHRRMMPPEQPETVCRTEGLWPVVTYINHHFREELTVRGLARTFYISEATLRRWFWDGLRTTPLEYLHKVRIRAAYTMLQNGVPVTEAASMAGYHSLSSFYRWFRRLYDRAPLASCDSR